MKTPQIIVLVIYVINLLVSANRHGKPRTPDNFWTDLVALIIMVGLLLWGGFFR